MKSHSKLTKSSKLKKAKKVKKNKPTKVKNKESLSAVPKQVEIEKKDLSKSATEKPKLKTELESEINVLTKTACPDILTIIPNERKETATLAPRFSSIASNQGMFKKPVVEPKKSYAFFIECKIPKKLKDWAQKVLQVSEGYRLNTKEIIDGSPHITLLTIGQNQTLDDISKDSSRLDKFSHDLQLLLSKLDVNDKDVELDRIEVLQGKTNFITVALEQKDSILQKKLQPQLKELLKESNIHFEEKHTFIPHITLGITHNFIDPTNLKFFFQGSDAAKQPISLSKLVLCARHEVEYLPPYLYPTENILEISLSGETPIEVIKSKNEALNLINTLLNLK